MNHIYKTLLILILIITIAIYFYTNRYEVHVVVADTDTKIVIINKWSGETLRCCKTGGRRFLSDRWINLGIPEETAN